MSRQQVGPDTQFLPGPGHSESVLVTPGHLTADHCPALQLPASSIRPASAQAVTRLRLKHTRLSAVPAHRDILDTWLDGADADRGTCELRGCLDTVDTWQPPTGLPTWSRLSPPTLLPPTPPTPRPHRSPMNPNSRPSLPREEHGQVSPWLWM